MEEKANELKTDILERDKQIDELRSSSGNSNELLNHMRTETNNMTQELAGIKEEKSKLNQNFQKLQIEMENLKEKNCIDVRKVQTDLENEITILTENLHRQSKESEELQNVKNDLAQKLQNEAEFSKIKINEMKVYKE